MNRLRLSAVLVIALPLLLLPASALAYGGPGSVVSGIGTFLAALATVAAAVLGFVWFPLKRLYKKLFRRGSAEGGDEEGGP